MSDRNLNAYYYGFDSTGHDAIDAILEAVARAGKAYHHTDQWDEPWEYGDEGGPSFTDVMQQRAQSAADRLAKLEEIRALPEKLRHRYKIGIPNDLGCAIAYELEKMIDRASAPAVCEWTPDDEGVYESDCGESWLSPEGILPEEMHMMKYCHGCGRRIQIAAAPQRGGDD